MKLQNGNERRKKGFTKAKTTNINPYRYDADGGYRFPAADFLYGVDGIRDASGDGNQPAAGGYREEIEVKESNLLTIRVDGEGRFWWNLKNSDSGKSAHFSCQRIRYSPDTVAYTIIF